MFRRTCIAALLAAGITLASCGSDDGEPAASPTPDAPPDIGFTLQPPAHQADAFANVPESGSQFVLDIASGLVQRLEQPTSTEIQPVTTVTWYDGDTLLVQREDAAYTLDLDGTVAALDGVPASTAEKGDRSTDGKWGAAVLSSAPGGVVVFESGRGFSDPSYRITLAGQHRWSPAENALLGMIGSYCLGPDMLLFEPETGTLRDLTSAFDASVFEFAWSPDGDAVAVAAVAPGAPDRRWIAQIDLDGDDPGTILIEMSGAGEVIPLAYSPDGSHLLFVARRTGRGFCEDAPNSSRVPSAVERLDE